MYMCISRDHRGLWMMEVSYCTVDEEKISMSQKDTHFAGIVRNRKQVNVKYLRLEETGLYFVIILQVILFFMKL